MNGILNIDKPAGWTSHDVVAWVRRRLGCKRVGHAGTLDPLATGVLLVCLGQATRLAEYLMAGVKTYRAEAELGIETDSYDADGTVVATAAVPRLSEEHLKATLAGFVGQILQQPPVYSAIKQNGVPLHRRARRGEVMHPAPRPVRIHHIELMSWQTPRLVFDVTCDPGTYIRSLVHDLGAVLGCGAVLRGLVRTRSGSFTLEHALSLAALAAAAEAGEASQLLLPMTSALVGWTRVAVDAEAAARLLQGRAIPCAESAPTALAYAASADQEVLAIVQHKAATHSWQPLKVFQQTD